MQLLEVHVVKLFLHLQWQTDKKLYLVNTSSICFVCKSLDLLDLKRLFAVGGSALMDKMKAIVVYNSPNVFKHILSSRTEFPPQTQKSTSSGQKLFSPENHPKPAVQSPNANSRHNLSKTVHFRKEMN